MKKVVISSKSAETASNAARAEIGVFGGSGFYSLFKKSKTLNLNTPYGKPSSEITIAEIYGRKVAFLPRHGKNHEFPPHKIPYKANIYAFKELGVERIISPCAAGSLNSKIKPGDFVILDQFIDRTLNRDDTFYHGPETVHISSANPYCNDLQKIALKSGRKLKINVHKKGTTVVINGPRFSTSAESSYYSNLGYDIINMTQYPEVIFSQRTRDVFFGNRACYRLGCGLGGKRQSKTGRIKRCLTDF